MDHGLGATPKDLAQRIAPSQCNADVRPQRRQARPLNQRLLGLLASGDVAEEDHGPSPCAANKLH